MNSSGIWIKAKVLLVLDLKQNLKLNCSAPVGYSHTVSSTIGTQRRGGGAEREAQEAAASTGEAATARTEEL
jgi:hypothetical protein